MLYEIHGHPSGEICAEWVFFPSRVIFGNEDILPSVCTLPENIQRDGDGMIIIARIVVQK